MPAPLVDIFRAEDYQGEIQRAARLLDEGKLIVLPTETVYGVAGRLDNAEAYRSLRALRPTDTKPLTIHLARRADADRYLGTLSELGRRMTLKLWPGPVALIFDVPAARRAEVAAELGLQEADLYDDGRVMLRCPDHPVAEDVIGAASGPVVATVAGAQAGVGPMKPSELAETLEGKVELVIDAGPTPFSKPSTIVRLRDSAGGGDYEIVREGVYDRRIIERLLQTTILFVCSGNTCRSPMAEALARMVLARKLGVGEAELESKGVQVVSAGALAMPGSRATAQAVEAVSSLGGDLSRHRSRPLSVELVHQADLIFTMGAGHARAVASLVPSSADKVVMLNPQGEIDDPIGSDVEVYRTLAGQMQGMIEQRLREQSLL